MIYDMFKLLAVLLVCIFITYDIRMYQQNRGTDLNKKPFIGTYLIVFICVVDILLIIDIII